jgi:ABC-2 type transport system ATP-binding protein
LIRPGRQSRLTSGARAGIGPTRATAVEVSHLYKSFQLPVDRPSTLKEQVVHPTRRTRRRELKVLEDISFNVKGGEFFGIVGRNGSGKSTLLKLLASVYRADAGRIRIAGQVAPVVELGVGFQPELSARANVLINGLMLGLTPREIRGRFPSIIEFAELEDFVDLKLKNYSSGMRARLAFAIVMQTEPDVLLLDEVLAVGDPPFQRKCREAFDEIKGDRSRTVLLVTHSMAHLASYCDRAMLLEGARIQAIGSPDEIAERYRRLQALRPQGSPGTSLVGESSAHRDQDPSVWLSAVSLVDRSGTPIEALPGSEPVRLHTTVSAPSSLESPRLVFRITSDEGEPVFAPHGIDFSREVSSLTNGSWLEVRLCAENRLPPGSYTAAVLVADSRNEAICPSEKVRFDVDIGSDGSTDVNELIRPMDFEVKLDIREGSS